mmetsp:Transcript_47300/g.86861  ORF Transcript_47300/g.86861 Transcript_47300/m.86861 type:complete len:756 (-) Transcript_47300:91-2358(-)
MVSEESDVDESESQTDEEFGEGAASATESAPLAEAAKGYPENNLPPKTGISVPMQIKPPNFIRGAPEGPEAVYGQPESLFEDVVKHEADRISHPELVLNKTVYDSFEVGPTGDPVQDSNGDIFPYYVPSSEKDVTLIFESRFGSGNLRRAIQVYEFEYDLILNPDYNTRSHTQWYYFRVSNIRAGPEYRFNIINMAKPTSLYNEGMRPLMYSMREATLHGVGWERCGTNIAYYQNGIRRKDQFKGATYFTLTFTIVFEHERDTVYLAHCYPYTYTDLQKDLAALERDGNMARRFSRRKLCDTLAGNACDLITITSFTGDAAALRQRRAVVVTARVHPGESNASWVMKGMLDYLTGPSLDARILRDNFVFKIIPMLNPDGVIVGNYRCSLSGQDLNRQWDDPSKRLHPTVYYAKNMLRHLIEDRDVILYIDLHGHSLKRNVFMYGNSEACSLREKVFPRLLSKNSDYFQFDDCCWKVQKGKESTARVVVYRELQIINSFTLEASFCGADFGSLADQHFTTKHLEEMGHMVCDAILDFCDPDQSKVLNVLKELQVLFPDDGNSDDVSDSDMDERTTSRRKKFRKVKKEKVARKKTVRALRTESTKVDEVTCQANAERSSAGGGATTADGNRSRHTASGQQAFARSRAPGSKVGRDHSQDDVGVPTYLGAASAEGIGHVHASDRLVPASSETSGSWSLPNRSEAPGQASARRIQRNKRKDKVPPLAPPFPLGPPAPSIGSSSSATQAAQDSLPQEDAP